MKVAQIKNFKMNDEVYKLRRQVINLIYEVKKEFLSFPRIEVRIGEARNHNVLGVAKLSKKQIWITKRADFHNSNPKNRFYGRTAKEWAIDQEKWHSLKNERTYSKHFE